MFGPDSQIGQGAEFGRHELILVGLVIGGQVGFRRGGDARHLIIGQAQYFEYTGLLLELVKGLDQGRGCTGAAQDRGKQLFPRQIPAGCANVKVCQSERRAYPGERKCVKSVLR